MSPAEGLPAGIKLRGQTKICRERPRFGFSLQKKRARRCPFLPRRPAQNRSAARSYFVLDQIWEIFYHFGITSKEDHAIFTQDDCLQFAVSQYQEAFRTICDYAWFDPANYPPGRLVCKTMRRTYKQKTHVYQYFFLEVSVKRDGKFRNRQTYIKKEKRDATIRRIRQRDRICRLLKEAEKTLRFWRAIMNKSQKLGKDRIAQIQQEAIAQGISGRQIARHRRTSYQAHIQNQEFRVLSVCGELVRSKNEGITADLLYFAGIPYSYEAPLQLLDHGCPRVLHPDFTLYLQQKTIYMEILGQMDQPEYAAHWLRRRTLYAQNGILLGKNLICFSCTSSNEFDCRLLFRFLRSLSFPHPPIPDHVLSLAIDRS